ncbi:MAG: lytic transglycosylase domain-containing protein [Candidatus Nanoarchaeia archaeon]
MLSKPILKFLFLFCFIISLQFISVKFAFAFTDYKLEVPLIEGQQPQTLGQYIKTFFTFSLGMAGIVALFALVFSGLNYLIRGASETQRTESKKGIQAAIFGLLLLIFSYLILQTIHPQFVSLQEPNLNQQIPMPGPSGGLEAPLIGSGGQQIPPPGQYIKTFFTFGLGLTGIVALAGILYGGFIYFISAGSQTMKTEGKKWIWAAISGLILLLLTFLILNTIHPQFISLKEPNLNQEVPITGPSGGTIEIPLIIGRQINIVSPAQYIKTFFIYGLGMVGIAALTALVFGGLYYITSAGSVVRQTEGKNWIWGAISGVALLLCSYLILFTINPQLVSLTNPSLEMIEIPPHLGLGYNLSKEQITALPIFSNPDINQAIKDASLRYSVPEDLIKAILGTESGGNINAVSPKGAQGLMQLMPETAAQVGVTNPFDPIQNIYGGVKYLGLMYTKFGNWTDAIAAYNAGPGNVIKYGGGANVPFKETQDYLTKIKSMLPQYF